MKNLYNLFFLILISKRFLENNFFIFITVLLYSKFGKLNFVTFIDYLYWKKTYRVSHKNDTLTWRFENTFIEILLIYSIKIDKIFINETSYHKPSLHSIIFCEDTLYKAKSDKKRFGDDKNFVPRRVLQKN